MKKRGGSPSAGHDESSISALGAAPLFFHESFWLFVALYSPRQAARRVHQRSNRRSCSCVVAVNSARRADTARRFSAVV